MSGWESLVYAGAMVGLLGLVTLFASTLTLVGVGWDKTIVTLALISLSVCGIGGGMMYIGLLRSGTLDKNDSSVEP